MQQPLLITDLDNTLYNWVDFFAPSFRAMVHTLHSNTGIGEDEIIDNFAKVYKEEMNIEFSYSIQSLEIFKNYPQEEQKKLQKLGQLVFSQTAKKNLHIFPTVQSTLAWAKSVGIILICVTNAPYNSAKWRLGQLGLLNFFYGLACRSPYDDFKLKNMSNIRKVWILSKDELKPNEDGYLKVTDSFNIQMKNVYIVGDTMTDIIPAIQIGANAILCHYDYLPNQKNIETISRISTKRIPQFSEFEDETSGLNFQTINQFYELKEIIKNPPHPTLPGF